MQTVVYLEGEQFINDDIERSIPVFMIKLMLHEKFGSPIFRQRLFYYPEHPLYDDGLPLCEDEHFNQDFPRLELVLTFGGFSTWAHFYVILPPDQHENRMILKMISCKFASIRSEMFKSSYSCRCQTNNRLLHML